LRITKRAADSLIWNGKSQHIIWDDSPKGFGLRVYPSGKKTFVLFYRLRGRMHIKTLGPYGILTVEMARNMALKRLVQLTGGEDPFPEKSRQQFADRRFKSLCADYIERHANQKKTGHEDERRINKHLLPAWEKLEVGAITSADVATLHHRITKTGAKYEANRVVTLVHTILDKAVEWGYLERGHENPAGGIQLNKESKRDRWLDQEELPRLGEAIAKKDNIYIRAVLWLYLLTGARKKELLKLKWDDVDTVRKEIRLGDTKAGRTHYIPLSDEAIALIDSIPKQLGNPHLFPGAKPGAHVVNIDKAWRGIRKDAGVEDVRLHDLRRTVGSWLAQSGIPLHLIGKILNHSNVSTTAIYSRFSKSQAQEAMENHGKIMADIMGRTPEPPREPATVTDLPKRKDGQR